MTGLDDLLAFSRLTHKLSATERFINKPHTTTRENLSEHCAQLALTAWYLIERYHLPLKKERVFEYALIHDIVETNTGDFPTHRREFDRDEKQRLEKESLEQLKQEYRDAPQLWKAYERYEKKDDDESKFVYALDKLLPELNIYTDSCRAWEVRAPKDNTWNFDDLLSRMQSAPMIAAFWEELRARILSERPELTI